MSPLFLIWLLCTSVTYKVTCSIPLPKKPYTIKDVVIFTNMEDQGRYYQMVRAQVKEYENLQAQ